MLMFFFSLVTALSVLDQRICDEFLVGLEQGKVKEMVFERILAATTEVQSSGNVFKYRSGMRF